MSKIALYILFILGVIAGFAQQVSELHAVGRPSKSSIKLRWAISDPLGWDLANQYGFMIERYTVTEGGKVLKDRVRKLLTPSPIQPAALPDWEQYMDDDYVAVVAQAIYGESFEVEENTSEIAQMLNQAQELENRFSFSMYAVDHSVKAAELAGVYYEDFEVYEDQKYLYQIYSLVPPEIHHVDTASVFTGLEDYYELPAPKDVAVTFGDRVAMISWNKELYKREYNSFWVERSDDEGVTFHRITDSPFVPIQKKQHPSLNDRAFKTDSLKENNKDYLYRVIGVSPFGELSKPSDTVGGTGLPVFTGSPTIIDHKILEDGTVILRWKFPEDQKQLLKNYDLFRENKKLKQQEPIKFGIGSDETSFSDESPHSSNYYLLKANDIYGRSTVSFPYFVQLDDSIPPVTPTGLQGYIDTLGMVHLSWDANTENDLLGYKLFKSNFEESEFIQVKGPMLTTNEYKDTIILKTLHEEIFYKVVALDRRYNPSGYSEALLLKKPDIIPPVSPVFASILNTEEGLALRWEFSSSDDVARHLLYRRSEVEPDWTLIHIMDQTSKETFFLDRKVEHNTQYAYTMQAVDDDGLESDPAVPVVAKRLQPDAYPAVDDLNYLVPKGKGEINISWSYALPLVDHFLVYKAEGDIPFELFTRVEASDMRLSDRINAGTTKGRYKVMAVMNNGYNSKMSDELLIELG